MNNPLVFVDPADVAVPDNRFREEFPESYLKELEESIVSTGLLHPPVAEQSDDTWILRAGECRLRVLRRLVEAGKSFRVAGAEVPRGTVPILEIGALSEKQRLDVEVEENIRRRDFNFVERTRALAAYHQSRLAANPSQTAQQTATEVNRKPAEGRSVSEVTNALIINKHLNDPDVAKAKDAKEALKIIKNKTDAIHRATLARNFDPLKTPHKMLKGSASDLLPTLPAASFDVILTDPPYGVGAHSFGDQSSTGHDYEDSPKHLEEILSYFCDESFRVAKERAHCYVFCDVRKFDRIATLMVLAGWEVFPTPLIWYKWNGMVPLPKLGPRRTYECILYAYKGKRETIVLKNDCIIKIPGVKKLLHGAQKPVALYCDLLSRSAKPGDAILDCMGGTGTILVAANILKLVATYIEKKDDAFNIAKQRLHTQEIDDGAEEDDGLAISFDEQS